MEPCLAARQVHTGRFVRFLFTLPLRSITSAERVFSFCLFFSVKFKFQSSHPACLALMRFLPLHVWLDVAKHGNLQTFTRQYPPRRLQQLRQACKRQPDPPNKVGHCTTIRNPPPILRQHKLAVGARPFPIRIGLHNAHRGCNNKFLADFNTTQPPHLPLTEQHPTRLQTQDSRSRAPIDIIDTNFSPN